MPLLTKAQLLDRVLGAIRSSRWTPLVIRGQHPFLVRAIGREESVSLRIYIWNLTSGGPSAVRPADELRIQITGVSPPLVVNDETATVLLGWHEEYGVFAGYDVSRHRQFGSSPSLQVREGTLRAAAQQGLHAQQRTSQDIVIAFAPDQFMHYVLRQAELHRFRAAHEVAILTTAARGEEVPGEELQVVPEPRRPVVRSVQQWSRQRSFRTRVLSAYQDQCAVCVVQLDLVEAAHIVPVGHPESNDLTPNGLCLCPLHHDAYDDGLLVVWPDYHVKANHARLDELIARGLGSGADDLRALECTTIFLPDREVDRPRPEYLRQGLVVRGWSP